VVANGQAVDLGDIVLQIAPQNGPLGALVDPVRMLRLQTTAAPQRAPQQTRRSPSSQDKGFPVAAIFSTPGGTAHIVGDDGRVSDLAREKDQVGSSSALISEDRRTVGWLVDSNFCCTSYPISLTLVVFRWGKPLRRFQGDGRAIFDWKFVAGGSQVAFYQDFLHGTPGQHYELRDVESGRLIGQWDGDLTDKAPAWARGLRS
jgi:hypothetical protein